MRIGEPTTLRYNRITTHYSMRMGEKQMICIIEIIVIIAGYSNRFQS